MRTVWPIALLSLTIPLAGCGAMARSAPPGTSTRQSTPKAAPAPAPDRAPTAACGLDDAKLKEIGATVAMAHVATIYPHSPKNRNQNLARASQYLCGTVLAPGRTLSFNAAIGETTVARGYTFGPTFVGNRVVPGMGGGVCQVATTLYDAWRKAGLQVVERHQHGMRVPYVPAGEDATVSNPYLDLVVRNSSPGPVAIAAVARDNRVDISLYGTEKPPVTAFRHKVLSTTPFPTIRIADPARYEGEEETVQEGVEGTVVHTWYVVERPGEPEKVLDLGVDSYRPSPHIIRYGTRPRPAAPAPAPDAGSPGADAPDPT